MEYLSARHAGAFSLHCGNKASGTRNLTEAYMLVAMGEYLKGFGASMDEIGRLMTLAYERRMLKMPRLMRSFMGRLFTNPKLLNRMFLKRDAQNAANAAKNPGSFETQTQIPPEDGYDFSYHNLVCPLANFARQYGYEAYMPYLCNLDYVMFGILGAPLFREHTCFDGDYCDFKLKVDAQPMPYWPPVFLQGKAKKPYIFVGMVCVREACQGQGYMRKLMDMAFAEGDRLGVPVILETDARSKCDRYVHLGMTLAGTRRFGDYGVLYDLIRYPNAARSSRTGRNDGGMQP